MKSDLELPNRRSIRLRGYDYSRNGVYFVTVCTRDRECILGEIDGDATRVNEHGFVVARSLQWLTQQYPYVELDECVVMPNHVHAIIVIGHPNASNVEGLREPRSAALAKNKTLGRLIGAFKTVSAKTINQMRNTPGDIVWQRNYYEHIITNDKELERIRHYIRRNPLAWSSDPENPTAGRGGSQTAG